MAGQEKLRRRLKQSGEKLQTKTTWSLTFFCSSVSFLAFPPPFFMSSDWLPMMICFVLIGWCNYFRLGFTTLNRNWLNGGITLAHTYLQRKDRRRGLTGTGTSNYLYPFGWCQPFARSSKLFTIGVILQNVFRYVVYEGKPRSRPLWMFRDTRSDKSPGPRNKFSCTDLEKSLGRESGQPRDQPYANQYRVLSNWQT